MARRDSIQKRLQRVRPPRVQLTYEVEKGDAVEQKELPFVVGVIGEFAGGASGPQPRLRDRKFVSVDLDNFDDVMAGMGPDAAYHVTDHLSGHGELAVRLNFRSMADFRPESVVAQVEPLRRLQEIRNKLADLRNKLAGNDRLEDLLSEALTDTRCLEQLKDEMASRGDEA
ncbi:MAG TPA: type VI secretion system contractile sheath small subunit [Nevskiaceae bacterium]